VHIIELTLSGCVSLFPFGFPMLFALDSPVLNPLHRISALLKICDLASLHAMWFLLVGPAAFSFRSQ